MSTIKKSNIEKHPLCQYIIDNWKKSSNDYVANYLRGTILKRDDNLSEELKFLIKIRKTMEEIKRNDIQSL